MRRDSGSASPDARRPSVVIAGFSTRALAESAWRAGWAVASVDAFADLDHPASPAIALARDPLAAWDARAVARASQGLPGGAAAYVASLENHPRAVALLARGRELLGNAPEVLERARDPRLLTAILAARGFPAPAVRARAPRAHTAGADARWLVKPRASGGGHGIAPWTAGVPLSRRQYLQERVAGVPGSLSFAADGRRVVPFALSRQLVGDEAFGASGFQYCGNILARAGAAAFGRGAGIALLQGAAAIAQALTEELGLVGVNGLDFIARDGIPFVTELNPRASASMELAERAFGVSVFGVHAGACRGVLPSFDLAGALRGSPALGKAVLFARRDVRLGDTRRWLGSPHLRDVPHPGETVSRGQPVCTIFARGRSAAECRAALVRRAAGVYEEIEGRRRRSA